jgi:hypothetical protein
LDLSDLSELDLIDGLDIDMDINNVHEYQGQYQEGGEIPLNKPRKVPQAELDLIDGLDIDMDVKDVHEIPISEYQGQYQQGGEIPLHKHLNVPQNKHKNTDIKSEMSSDINGTTKIEKNNDCTKDLTVFDTILDPLNGFTNSEEQKNTKELQKGIDLHQDHVNKPQNYHKGLSHTAFNREHNHVEIELKNNIDLPNIDIPQVEREDGSPNSNSSKFNSFLSNLLLPVKTISR